MGGQVFQAVAFYLLSPSKNGFKRSLKAPHSSEGRKMKILNRKVRSVKSELEHYIDACQVVLCKFYLANKRLAENKQQVA